MNKSTLERVILNAKKNKAVTGVMEYAEAATGESIVVTEHMLYLGTVIDGKIYVKSVPGWQCLGSAEILMEINRQDWERFALGERIGM